MKEYMAGNGWQTALQKYRANLLDDCFALWKLWVPVMAFSFTFAPVWARIPVVTTASLLWTMIISFMRGSNDDVAEEDDLSSTVIPGVVFDNVPPSHCPT